jgi:hypothetical protein
VWTGETGAPETITLMNWGYSPITVTGITLMGNDGDFSMSAPSCSPEAPIVLKDLTGIDITLTFSPSSFGTHTATIRVDFIPGSASYTTNEDLTVKAEGDWYAIKGIAAVDDVFKNVKRVLEYGGDILIYGEQNSSSTNAVYRYNGTTLSELRYNGTSINWVEKFIKHGSDILLCGPNHLYRYNGTTMTQDISGYYNYDQIINVGSLIYFIDHHLSGIIAAAYLDVYDGSTVKSVDISAAPVSITASSSTSATMFLGVLGDDLIISASGTALSSPSNIYRITGDVLYPVTNSSDYNNSAKHGLVYQNKVYFIGRDSTDTSKMYVYDKDTGVANVPAFAAADLSVNAHGIGVFENKMYYPSRTGAQIYEFDGISLTTRPVPNSGRIITDYSDNIRPIEWNSSLVMLSEDSSGKSLLVLQAGQFSHISWTTFESPILYEGRIICGPKAAEISTTGASNLYAGDSDYYDHFEFYYPTLAHGNLYFIGDRHFMPFRLYCFNYTR